MHYVVQDVGVFFAGVMGLWGCVWYWLRMNALEHALSVNPPAFTGDQFEASVQHPP